MQVLTSLVNGSPTESNDWQTKSHSSLGDIRFHQSREADIDAVFDSMRHGAPPVAATKEQLENVLLEIDRHFLSFARWYSAETGYLLRDAMAMIGAAKMYCSDLRHSLEVTTKSEVLPFSTSNQSYTRNAVLRNLPRGRIAFVLPANSPWPLAMIYGLAANHSRCRALILPSSKTPVSGLAAAKCLEALGPESGVSILNASTREVLGRALKARCFDAVHFVGSNRLYADIAADCARNGLSLTYEGEGNCVAVVDACSNEVPRIAKIIRDAALRCNGQLCSSISGVLCTGDSFDALRTELTNLFRDIRLGDGLMNESDLGPLLGSTEALTQATTEAVKRGAILLTGGSGSGREFPATLLEITAGQWEFALKENFGPLVWIRKLSQGDDLLKLIDEIGSGLTVSVFGKYARESLGDLMSRARFARICVDCDPTIQSPMHPWGNYGTSGFSRTETFAQKCLLPISIESIDDGEKMFESRCLRIVQPGRIESAVYSSNKPVHHVLVKNLYSGVCGTDREVFRGNLEAAFPFIPGHENVGQVVSVPNNRLASNGEELHEGEYIAWNPLIACGKCKSCLDGRENCCLHLQVFGLGMTCEIEPHLFGGWSQNSVLPPSTQIHKLPRNSNMASFVFADPVATAIRVFKQANGFEGDWLVIGSGALGCSIAAALTALGTKSVWMAGNSEQLESAAPFCGEQFFDMTRNHPLHASHLLSRGVRPSHVVDTVGSAESVSACIETGEPGASIFLVGGLVTRQIPFNSGSLTKSEVAIRGVLAYTNQEFADAIKLIETKPEVFAQIQTHELALTEAQDCIFNRSNRKVIINCQK